MRPPALALDEHGLAQHDANMLCSIAADLKIAELDLARAQKLIDTGVIPGPRILPSGPPISQTSGHFDYRPHQGVPEGNADP